MTLNQMIEDAYGEHLPIFPTFVVTPDEARLERVVERLMDVGDAALMAGKATQAQYDRWVIALYRWAGKVRS